MTRFLGTLAFLLLAAAVQAGVGQPVINISMVDQGPDPICLMVIPDGSGPTLTGARNLIGDSADATISVEVLSLSDEPIVGLPAEDIWFESGDDGLVPCQGGTIADAPTDVLGQTTISLAPRAGGWSLEWTYVFVQGNGNTTPLRVPLIFNSPDINGDLEVNLSDIQLFAMDFYDTVYQHRSDLAFDGQVNLSDIIPLSEARGAACP